MAFRHDQVISGFQNESQISKFLTKFQNSGLRRGTVISWSAAVSHLKNGVFVVESTKIERRLDRQKGR
jgi:hypothetical protein